MKKTSFLAIILIVFVGIFMSSCSGGSMDDTNSGNYFRFKLNGEEKKYDNAVANYKFVQSRNKHVSLYVSGNERKGEISNNPTLSIQVDAALTDGDGNWLGIDIVTGTYSAAYNTGYALTCNHYVTGLDNYTVHNANFVLNLEYIDKHRAKGTFSGVLKDDNDNMMTITDGEFNVRVVYSESAN